MEKILRGAERNEKTKMQKLEQLYEGKAKKVFRTDDPELYIVDYKDDATAFNGQKKGTIASKGVVNNKMSAIIFQQLEEKRRANSSGQASQRQRDLGKGCENPSAGSHHPEMWRRVLFFHRNMA